MLKKLIHKLFSPIIKEMVAQEIEQLLACEPPKLDELRISYVKSGNKMTGWQALEGDPIEISLCVSYIDINGLEDFRSYKITDVAHLRIVLLKFKPIHDLFTGVSLHIKPKGSTKSIVENLIKTSYYGDRQYNTLELPKIFNPVIAWIDERPELLV